MSNGDQALDFVYLMGVLVLIVSALAVRRIPMGQGLKMFGAWALIFGALFVAFTLKDDFIDLWDRVVAESRGRPIEMQSGETVRIRQAADGHYWVTAELNGKEFRFLVDSGATITSISNRTARVAGIEPGDGLPAIVQTANGRVQVQRGRAETVQLGSIRRADVAVHIYDGFGDTNVLGMNFLSSLSSWGVEKRWLVLKP